MVVHAENMSSLDHIKGSQSVGVRGGVGTKNKFDVGLTYTFSFNNRFSLTMELDHEEAQFGESKFSNVILVAPGVDFNVWNPTKWFYLSLSAGGALGCDVWKCDDLATKQKGFVAGPQAGVGFEFLPVSFISILAKAQQAALFGNESHYFKPNFSLGVRYNFHL